MSPKSSRAAAARLKTITADFVMLSKDDAFASTDGGISLADVATGQRLRVTDAAQLVIGPSTSHRAATR